MTPAGPSVARRLGRAYAVVVTALLLVAGAGVVGVAVVEVSHAQEDRLRALDSANTQMLLAMTNAETSVRGYRLAQDRAFLEPYEQGSRDFPRQAEEALALADEPAARRLVQRQVQIAEHWFAVYADPVSAMAPGTVTVSPGMTITHKQIFDRLRAVNADLHAWLAEESGQARAHERAVRAGALAVTGVSLVLALVVVVVAARRTRGALVSPLAAVVAVLGRLASGDHAARADARTGPWEVRAVSRSVNALADESDRLRHERAEAVRFSQLAAEIDRGIRDSLVAEESLQAAVTELGRALGVDRAWVRLLEAGGLGAATSQWHAPGLGDLHPEVGEQPAGGRDTSWVPQWVQELHEAGEPFQAADVLEAAARSPRLQTLHDRTGATSVLVCAVGAGDVAVGVLTLMTHSGPRRWTPDEIALARAVAASLGRALALARTYRQEQELVAQLRELDQSKTDFLATISHELRTPLTSIAGYLELIRDGDAGEVPAEADAMLAVVERNTVRLRTLIEDLLTLSRIESGAFRVSRGDVGLDVLVASVVAVLRPAAESAGLHLDVEVAPGDAGPLVVHGDAVQLERALLNLTSNAVKFTPPGGLVRVRTGADGPTAVLEVTDTGMGIPEQEQEQLFSRFFRASNAVQHAVPGTGLGLTIVRSIVEHHDGALSVHSVEGVGTRVTVRLPARTTEVALAAAGRTA